MLQCIASFFNNIYKMAHLKRFKFYRQHNMMDCGPACLRMIAKFHGKHYNIAGIKQITGFNPEGVSLLSISVAAEKLGFKTDGIQVDYEELKQKFSQPCIIYWDQNHFVVLLSFSEKSLLRSGYNEYVRVADPSKGIISYEKKDFLEHWANGNGKSLEPCGTVLLLEPTPFFYDQQDEKENKLSWQQILHYLKNTRGQVVKVAVALLLTSVIQFAFPFFTKNIVDKGIQTKDLDYVTLILLGQLMLILTRTGVDFLRSRLLFKISTHIHISILSDFWLKLTKLPLSYFENHHTGDTLQRIADHRQIENFLTGSAITSFFSFFNFIIFSIVLVFYSMELFLVFAIGSMLYFFWVKLFLHIRRKINYNIFHLSAKENNAALQLIQGMQEIKLYNAEDAKRLEWEKIQSDFYKSSFKNLSYNQIQQIGAVLLNEGRNILITFLVAKHVIEGSLSIGTMLAVQYVIGQLSSPIEQLIGFIQSAQDAKISMERLNEVHNLPNEESRHTIDIQSLPVSKTIELAGISFSYPGNGDDQVLKNLNVKIEEGKVTAIVGESGSGKSTLIKLLLRFFDNYTGDIKIGGVNFTKINPSHWRTHCGAVLQNGYIFNDSITNNIVVNQKEVDWDKLKRACTISNILAFIQSLPIGFSTQLGANGMSLSQGQKQRLLIARSIYKNPDYLFLDEATNSLDTNNEKVIVENLHRFYSGKTVVIIAHRLSTVKNADKIIVMENGSIVEEGNHTHLSLIKGKYFNLIKNQLDLAN